VPYLGVARVPSTARVVDAPQIIVPGVQRSFSACAHGADARAASLARGLLPTVKALKTFAGLGNGRPCDGCGQSITPTDVEYELVFGDFQTVRMHRDCLAIWQQANRQLIGGVIF
jgi:hypothetical protein